MKRPTGISHVTNTWYSNNLCFHGVLNLLFYRQPQIIQDGIQWQIAFWIYFNFFFLFVYLAALSGGTQGLLFVTCELSVPASGIWFPDQGLNPGPLHWECGVLASGPPGKCPEFSFYKWKSPILNVVWLLEDRVKITRQWLKNLRAWASLVVQWLRICLPRQGSQFPSLVKGRFHTRQSN